MALFAGRFSVDLQDKYGNGFASASVLVQTEAGGAVTLYADETKALEATNPVTADAKGNLVFFTDPQRIRYIVTPVGGIALTPIYDSVRPDPLETEFLETRLDVLETTGLSIAEYNPIADGEEHLLSERYASLSAAQVDYPNAVALTDTIDYQAGLEAIKAVEAAGGGTVFIPPVDVEAGEAYVLNKPWPLTKRCWIQGAGSASLIKAAGAGDVLGNVFQVGMHHPAHNADYTLYVLDAITEGDISITFTTPSESENFSVGQVVMLRSNEHEIQNTFQKPFFVELNRILAIDSGTGVATLEHSIDETVSNPRITDMTGGSFAGMDTFISDRCGVEKVGVDANQNWVGRNASYECTFRDVWVKRSHGLILGNAWSRCYAERIFGNFTYGFAELATGAHHSTFRSIWGSYKDEGNPVTTTSLIKVGEHGRHCVFEDFRINAGEYQGNFGLRLQCRKTTLRNGLVTATVSNTGVYVEGTSATYVDADLTADNECSESKFYLSGHSRSLDFQSVSSTDVHQPKRNLLEANQFYGTPSVDAFRGNVGQENRVISNYFDEGVGRVGTGFINNQIVGNSIPSWAGTLTNLVLNDVGRIKGALSVDSFVVKDGTDQRVGILAAIALCQGIGGGQIDLGLGTCGFTGEISFPTGVDPIGHGGGKAKPATILKCLDSTARISIGTTGVDSRGGVCGNFLIDGNNIATQPFRVGRRVHTAFDPITVKNAAVGRAGVVIEEAQNNHFRVLNIQDCAGPGIVFDGGTGGHLIDILEVNNCGSSGTFQVIFTQTYSTPALYPVPSHIRIIQPIVERPASGALGSILHSAGRAIDLDHLISAWDTGESLTHIKMEYNGVHVSFDLHLRKSEFSNSSNIGTVFDVGSGCKLLCEDRPHIVAAEFLFKLGTSGTIELPGTSMTSAYATELDPNSSGSLGALVRSRYRFPLQINRRATTDATIIQQIDNESGARFRQRGDGRIDWGSGNDFVYDTNLYRLSASVLKTDDKLIAGEGIGIGNAASAEALGAVVRKMEVFDTVGNSLGFIPIYDEIT